MSATDPKTPREWAIAAVDAWHARHGLTRELIECVEKVVEAAVEQERARVVNMMSHIAWRGSEP